MRRKVRGNMLEREMLGRVRGERGCYEMQCCERVCQAILRPITLNSVSCRDSTIENDNVYIAMREL